MDNFTVGVVYPEGSDANDPSVTPHSFDVVIQTPLHIKSMNELDLTLDPAGSLLSLGIQHTTHNTHNTQHTTHNARHTTHNTPPPPQHFFSIFTLLPSTLLRLRPSHYFTPILINPHPPPPLPLPSCNICNWRLRAADPAPAPDRWVVDQGEVQEEEECAKFVGNSIDRGRGTAKTTVG